MTDRVFFCTERLTDVKQSDIPALKEGMEVKLLRDAEQCGFEPVDNVVFTTDKGTIVSVLRGALTVRPKAAAVA